MKGPFRVAKGTVLGEARREFPEETSLTQFANTIAENLVKEVLSKMEVEESFDEEGDVYRQSSKVVVLSVSEYKELMAIKEEYKAITRIAWRGEE